MLLIATFFTLCVAPPNPIPDNETDESVEHRNYYYPLSEKHPYWEAFSTELKTRLKRHDLMERALNKIRELDFKLRKAWTESDKPFTENWNEIWEFFVVISLRVSYKCLKLFRKFMGALEGKVLKINLFNIFYKIFFAFQSYISPPPQILNKICYLQWEFIPCLPF